MLFQFLKTSSIQIGALVMMILFILAFLSPTIMELLYGTEFKPYAFILIGFCIIYIFVYLSHPLRFALRTLEMTRPIFIAYLLAAVFSLLAAAPMLREWGIYGLLLGLLTTQIICQVVYIISLRKIRKFYENHSLDPGQS